MKKNGKSFWRMACLAVLFSFLPLAVWAIDPPHWSASAACGACHFPHTAPGADLTTVAGDANLCMSCHSPGGSASDTAFVAADQAQPWPGQAMGTSPAGTSHRWDAGAAGHLQFLGGAATASTGTIIPAGAYTNGYPKTYTLQMAVSGMVGGATFNWSATSPGGGSGSGVVTGTNSPLDGGVFLRFVDGTNVSFQAGDKWTLSVRPGLNQPANAAVLAQLVNGMVTCSACHDQHSEALPPFDPGAQPYATNLTGTFIGTNRHFMRIANNLHQLCNDCHSARNVTNAAAGSHPVEITLAADAKHKLPGLLPLETATTNLGCLTCHLMHHSPAAGGKVLRLANTTALCDDCHTLANPNSAHFATTNPATLWPGGKFGSLMPARTDASDAGTCLNCHAIHGWPTNSPSSTIRYEHLLADYQENFCYTCHGTNGPAVKLVYAGFQQAYHHPVLNSDPLRRTGRAVECDDCHNPHAAQAGSHVYTATATAARNTVANAPSLIGVDGVAFNYSGLTNFQTLATNRFSYIPKTTGATNEYQICFKCHSGYFWGAGTPPNGISTNGSVATPGETDLAQEFSPMNLSGHPIMTGLNNYLNSVAPKALAAAALKSPWNANVGTQTMMCSDCHDATTTNYVASAAQGPHGSAYQYMLRGPNGANWPNVQLSNFGSSWCANCHNNSANGAHTDDHSSARCYNCHIVIPHGGKMSRLIGDGDGSMPARYAWNNQTTNMLVQSFTKASGSYSKGNCRAGCGEHTSGSSATMENW